MTQRLAAALSAILIGLAACTADAAERPRVSAVRAEGALHLDGRLDEPDWGRATPIGSFRLIEVREGEAPSESTEVRVLTTPTHVWLGIRCGNQTPGPVRASLSPRDQILDDDHIAVHLDTYRDFRRAYIFGVNPHGVQLDGILDGEEPDFSWDAIWDAEAVTGATEWTAEIAVPLQTLRFPAGGEGVWGLWLRRQITKQDEVCSWPLYRLAEAGDIMLQAGDLEGLAGLRGGGGLEAQPYTASIRADARAPAGSGLGGWEGETRTDAGLDLRYGLTSTLTGNLTVNPDYSQVEADALQIDVNQRFPLFFEEKRPFFLEGAETFSTFFRLVHTRRIADPALGGKLIGKLGRWRLGAIAVSDDGGGSGEGIGARSSADPTRSGFFTVGRVAYDLGENSRVGLLVTDHLADDLTTGMLPYVPPDGASGSRNTVVSADTKLRLAKPLFFYGQIATSHTRLDSLRTGLEVPTRFSDYLSTLTVEYNDGKRFVLAYQDYLGADFRADAGFLERVDARTTGYDANWTFRPENRWLRYVEPASNGNLIRTTRGELEERRFAGAIRWGFQKQTFAETRIAHVDENWLGTVYDRWRYILTASNTLWRPLALEFAMVLEDGIFYADADSASFLGWLENWGLEATVRPSPRLTSEINVARNRFTRTRGGEEVFDVWQLGAKTTYQFTRRLYARLYPQYDTYAKHLDADALVGYVLHPGSVLYLGVTGDFDEVNGRRRATQRSLFLKVSYAFQR